MNKHTNIKTDKKDKRKDTSLDNLLFKEDIKERYHLGETAFYKWVRSPDVKAFKYGGKWQIRVKDLLEWEEIQIENKAI